MYIEEKEKSVEKLENELKEQGYKTTKEKIESASKTIIINRKQVTEEQIKNLQKFVGNTLTEDGEDSGDYNCTIIIGNDYE